MEEKAPLGSEPLTFLAMPELAEALRSRKQSIIRTWQEIVKRELPNAEDLTISQVRDSIPLILDRLSDALASDHAKSTNILVDVTGIHGEERFHENYNVDELLTEYQILRQILLHEVGIVLGGAFTTAQTAALGAGMDIVVHQGTSTFVRFLSERLRASAESEIKFLAFLSHDLRNGLGSILAALNLMSRKMQTHADFADEARWLESAKTSITKTVAGMERLLSAERLRKQSAKPKFEPVALEALVTRILAPITSEAKLKGICLENFIAPTEMAHTDDEILSIALTNLIGNAIKYSSKGTIKVSADLPVNSRKWKIFVSDEGHGIASAELEKIFSAFSRAETYGQEGMGLGLAITAQSVRLLGGSITVESKQGLGSTFILNFDKGGKE